MSKSIVASILAITTVAFAGSAAAADDQATSATSSSSSAGQYTSAEDSAVTARIQDRLSQDRALKMSGINVQTVDGKVQLNGFANTQAEKNAAGELARRAADGKQVSNNVLVYEQGE